jgi:hypothetical protein
MNISAVLLIVALIAFSNSAAYGSEGFVPPEADTGTAVIAVEGDSTEAGSQEPVQTADLDDALSAAGEEAAVENEGEENEESDAPPPSETPAPAPEKPKFEALPEAPDIFKFEYNENENGGLVHKYDTNGDGKADFYEVDYNGDGLPDATFADADGDGHIDIPPGAKTQSWEDPDGNHLQSYTWFDGDRKILLVIAYDKDGKRLPDNITIYKWDPVLLAWVEGASLSGVEKK